MKITQIILAGAFVANAAAQIPPNFPPCGEVCIKNMLELAPQLGCKDKADAKCLCQNQNFLYGIRDCAAESCKNETASVVVTQFGLDYCASNGAPVTLPSGTSISGGTSGTAAPVPTGVIVTTITSGGSSIVSTISGAVAGASSSASGAVAGASSSASGAVAGASSSASSAAAAGGSSVSSLISSGAGITSSIASATGSAASSLSSVASSLSSAASSASASASRTGGVGPRQTAAPVGLLAIAGAAAFLL